MQLKFKIKQIILLGGLLFILGIVLAFIMNAMLIPYILTVLGIEIVVFTLITRHIFKNSSLKALSIWIIVFSILNFARHSMFFIVLSSIGELFENDPEFIWFLVRESIWLITSIWILYCGFDLIKRPKKLEFAEYVKSNQFRILSTIIIILLILEIPIFGIHGDYGGWLHGHGFWESGTHIH